MGALVSQGSECLVEFGVSWSELVWVWGLAFLAGLGCVVWASFPFLLLNIMMHSSPAFFEKKLWLQKDCSSLYPLELCITESPSMLMTWSFSSDLSLVILRFLLTCSAFWWSLWSENECTKKQCISYPVFGGWHNSYSKPCTLWDEGISATP